MQLLLMLVVVSGAGNARHFYPYSRQQQDFSKQEAAANDVTVVDAKTGIKYNPYSKHHPGRHVCASYKNVTYPVKTTQVFCKPTYKKYMVRCGNQWCEGVKLVYEKYYKEVPADANQTVVEYTCCPGWTQVTYRSYGCNKPLCDHPCQNGGRCVKPNCCTCPPGYTGPYCETSVTYYNNPECSPPCRHGGTCVPGHKCLCPPGFTGLLCERDVDECKTLKPCDHICYNTIGSFRCDCKENFVLRPDGQTCHREIDEGTTLETKDLEFQRLDRRLNKLERMIVEKQKNQVSKKDISLIYDHIDKISNNLINISDKLKNLDSYKEDMDALMAKLNSQESKMSLSCNCEPAASEVNIKQVPCKSYCPNY